MYVAIAICQKLNTLNTKLYLICKASCETKDQRFGKNKETKSGRKSKQVVSNCHRRNLNINYPSPIHKHPMYISCVNLILGVKCDIS